MPCLLTVDQNLRHAMRFFGYATGAGEILEVPGALLISSGLNYGVFNLVLLTAPVAELEPLLAAPARYFRERGWRWSWWICEDLLERPLRRRARAIFNQHGFRALSHPPGMIAERLLAPARPLPAIECRRVSSAATRRVFAEISAVCFDIPQHVAHQIYEPDSAWQGDYQGFVGYVDGQPVAAAAIVAAAGALGVYSLGTLPACRRRGYGEALMRAALAEVRAATGIEPTVLQSTDAGFALYRRMGFREVTRFAVFLSG